ncbi:hypothetical protein RhiirA5_437989 [Rhizophagus irregularis]|uniref:Uncharacterized protein n=1 Tax=Rhizophagus irregularis TaxID=588596 RepID=A0A2I1FE84_9GLOM|nr:hypothetical protein RhiirA5_437989 [Rhizophagus irregularis]PKC53524.1 hypothetical protein RhiirA1_479134 [Rhizophagus irregularis]PKY32668.1 hypothetical protein RhiirB3_451026 [Rhizophagus irregularis]CAB4474259.1 unnamed protein product [Rhizophagus irregularis]CAB5216050.1 unnamed protein product [Rhizophagus irregularis]
MSSDKKKSKKQKKKKNTVPKDVQAINVGISSKSIETSFLPFTGKTYILRVLFCKEATHVINKIVSMEDVELTDIVPSSKEDVQISNVGPFSEEDFQTINVEATHVIDKIVSMGDVEPTEVAPSLKEDVQINNVSTSSKNKGKSKKIASSLNDKSVSMEGVESTKVSLTSKDREASSTTPSVNTG